MKINDLLLLKEKIEKDVMQTVSQFLFYEPKLAETINENLRGYIDLRFESFINYDFYKGKK